jgi:hypothetical protein
MADESHSGLTDGIEHVVAANMQRGEIDLQILSHNAPLYGRRRCG